MTVELRHPTIDDGADVWRLARDSKRLDLNTPYAYLMWMRDFHSTTLVAEVDGELGGFVTGYMRPDEPSTVMVWQIAVDAKHRGQGIAGRLLDELAARTGATALETTITDDNPQSQASFDKFAQRHGAEHTVTPLFETEHFPHEDEFKPELLHRIAPLRHTDTTS